MSETEPQAKEFGIIDHPYSDARVVVFVEAASRTRVTVRYWSKGKFGTQKFIRRARYWRKLSPESDFGKVAESLSAAFMTFVADKRLAREKFDDAVREAGNAGPS